MTMQTTYTPRPVWTEGMLLCPQHMQQQDIFHEANLHERLAAMTPIHWGVVGVKFDLGALKTGQLQITQFRGVFPDGTAVSFDSTSSHRPPSRPVSQHFPASAASIDVYLALPALREGVANFAAGEASSGTHRFRTVSRTVFDTTLARSERELYFSEPNLVLLFGSEPRDDFTAIKIAELGRDETGSYRQVEDYIPPCLAVSAASWLTTAVQEIVSLAVAKRRALLKFSTQDTSRHFYTYMLGTNIPVLKHLLETPNASPLAVYTVLLQFAGGLMTFAGDRDPTDLPGFSYMDLRATFSRLCAEIRRLLGFVVRESFYTIPLSLRTTDSVWLGEFKDERLQRCASFILAVDSAVDRPTVMRDLPDLAKIASWKRIGLVVKKNTIGVPLRPIAQPPPEVPVQPNHVYFAITTEDPHWREIMTERNIALYIKAPYDPQHTKLTLIALPPRDD